MGVPPYRFGSRYYHALVLAGPDFGIKRYSRELCFASLLHPAAKRCDGIQFVMGAMLLRETNALAVSVGINDCQSALVTLPLTEVTKLLEFTAPEVANPCAK